MAKKKSSNKKFPFNTIIILVSFAIVCFYFFNSEKPGILFGYAYEEVEENYGKEIDLYSGILQLPPTYFKSLAILECSGKKDFPHRFESHVYKKLQEVKQGKRSEYEYVTKEMLQNANDDAIRNLATSWGPFQIMGYKCLELKINIVDLRGDDAVFWGITWINKSYGKYLRQGKFKDAFHIHNTGKPFPLDGKSLTHNSNYVQNGLKYMTHFKK